MSTAAQRAENAAARTEWGVEYNVLMMDVARRRTARANRRDARWARREQMRGTHAFDSDAAEAEADLASDELDTALVESAIDRTMLVIEEKRADRQAEADGLEAAAA